MAMTLQQCSTISDFISYGKSLDISHDKLHSKALLTDSEGNKVIMNYTSILQKYSDFLKKIIVDVTLTEEEYQEYRFKPKALSLKMYGTTELWSSILSLNNMTSMAEFDKKSLKLYTQDIFNMINEILILEDDTIRENRKSVGL